MSTAVKIATDVRNDANDAGMNNVDDGSAAGYIEIRTGSQPANCAAAATGTLLATNVGSDPFFGASSGGTKTAAAISDDTSADATGTAGWWGLYDSNGSRKMQGDCGEAGDSPSMVFNNKNITAGNVVKITSFTVTMPET